MPAGIAMKPHSRGNVVRFAQFEGITQAAKLMVSKCDICDKKEMSDMLAMMALLLLFMLVSEFSRHIIKNDQKQALSSTALVCQ